jgi:hypothetical protein
MARYVSYQQVRSVLVCNILANTNPESRIMSEGNVVVPSDIVKITSTLKTQKEQHNASINVIVASILYCSALHGQWDTADCCRRLFIFY